MPRRCRTAVLLSGLLICAPALAQSSTSADGAPPQVVTITGQVSSDLRPYSRYRPGIVEFKRYHHLAPAAGLRFGMVTGSFPMKPLPLVKARLERHGFWSDYDEDLPIVEDGWFTIPDVPDEVEARRSKASVVVSRRNGSSASWMIDVHTPGLPAQVRHELNGLEIRTTSFSLDLAPDEGTPAWSDDALVEFVFYGNSRWIGLPGR